MRRLANCLRVSASTRVWLDAQTLLPGWATMSPLSPALLLSQLTPLTADPSLHVGALGLHVNLCECKGAHRLVGSHSLGRGTNSQCERLSKTTTRSAAQPRKLGGEGTGRAQRGYRGVNRGRSSGSLVEGWGKSGFDLLKGARRGGMRRRPRYARGRPKQLEMQAIRKLNGGQL